MELICPQREEPGLFDTLTGLPVHVLVLHFTVVLVPISALITIAVFLRKRWHEQFAGRVALWNVAMLALTFVTVRAGVDLRARYRGLGDTQTPKHHHAAYGYTLLWIMVALAVLSLATIVLGRMRDLPAGAVTGLAGVVALLAVVSIVFTILTGDAGSRSRWRDFISSSDKHQTAH